MKFLVEAQVFGYTMRRAPQGARGLKCICDVLPSHASAGRAPQGARGLKYLTS